uniref:Alpha/beta-hydrolase n=1 Tax=Mycena chlorophos TaxID=658473 RepID=A0ABQ0LMI9_MYCCL|nr:predicted protein [Mycena chlorophos]
MSSRPISSSNDNDTKLSSIALLPVALSSRENPPTKRHKLFVHLAFFCIAVAFSAFCFVQRGQEANAHRERHAFYHNASRVSLPCASGPRNASASYAGHIGLEGDSEDTPKRSFFWYFSAEEDPEDAPLILSMGGGPGTSGLMNALWGQSPCLVTEAGLTENPNRWTQKHNLLILDHPIGAGFSYGTRVNNSFDARADAYNFLQKFFVLFPKLARNKLVLSGGSYGGIHVPNIATAIHQHNLLIDAGKGHPGTQHVNLEALILSNPLSNPHAHFSWLLHYRCVTHQLHNTTTCAELFTELPACLDAIQMAFDTSKLEHRQAAAGACWPLAAEVPGINTEDIREECANEPTDDEDAVGCHEEFVWVPHALDNTTTHTADGRVLTVREALGLPPPSKLPYKSLNRKVAEEFGAQGDIFRQHHELYTPLLEAGIRVLHYTGLQDANCAWPGIESFLTYFNRLTKRLSVPPLTSRNFAHVRVEGAGHFTVKDQPALAKRIVETWVADEPWF